MNRIKKYISGLGRTTRVLVLAIAVVIAGAGITQAATTISTNILTNGTLGATGVSTFGGTASTTISVAGVLTTPASATALFLGGASTTQLTLLSGDTIKNTTASTTVLSGSLTSGLLTVSGATTLSSTVGVTGLATFLGGASTTQFTLLSGDTIKNASASSTVISGALQTTGGFTGTTGTFSSTLGITGLATFLGGASTTQFTLLSGDTIKNASASSTALSGNLTVGGGTGSATLTVTNTASATSTVTAGCVVTTATSSATSIRLMFNTQATTTSINGNTVQGVVLWGYGTSCAN